MKRTVERPVGEADLKHLLHNIENALRAGAGKSGRPFMVGFPSSNSKRARDIDGKMYRGSARRVFQTVLKQAWASRMRDFNKNAALCYKVCFLSRDEAKRFAQHLTTALNSPSLREDALKAIAALPEKKDLLPSVKDSLKKKESEDGQSTLSQAVVGPEKSDLRHLAEAGLFSSLDRCITFYDVQAMTETNCQDTHPLQNLPREVQAVLWKDRINYDMTSCYEQAAGVSKEHRIDVDALTNKLGCSRDAVKSYRNLLLQGNEPHGGVDSWMRARYEEGLDHVEGRKLRDALHAAMFHLQFYASDAATLQKWRRDTTRKMASLCWENGIRVMMHMHDGLIVDKPIPDEVILQVFASTDDFRIKPFC